MAASEAARRLGLAKSRRGWRGDCPSCGYKSAFALDRGRDGRAIGWCANCQDKSAIGAALRGGGFTWSAPSRSAEAVPAADAAARRAKQERALSLWRGAKPAPGTLADCYLIGRALSGVAASPALRFRSDTPHPEGGRLPAMLAAVTDGTGALVAVHRTYLDAGGGKAKVEPAKASLGPVWGGAIRLEPLDHACPLVIGEGIETAASAGRLTGWPAWAAVSAGNMAKGLVLPAEARRVVIAADPDEPGEQAARAAALRWQAEGREVQIMRPTGAGDFNDLLQRRVARETADAR